MKKMSWLIIPVGAVVIIGLLMLIGWIVQPPAADPGPGRQVLEVDVKASIKGNLDGLVCDFEKDAVAVANFQQSWMFSRDGADQVIVGSNTLGHVFDGGSPRSAEAHDRLILVEEPPSELDVKRVGSALLLCDKNRIGVVIIRQYCVSNEASPPWNNEIEEIAFPKYGEVWLNDEIYAGLANPNAFAPPPELLQELRSKYTGFAISDTWKARRFSDVLPSAPQAALECRRDFDGVEKFE